MGKRMERNKMAKGKKKLVIILTTLTLILSIVGITYAWFISRDSTKIIHTLDGFDTSNTKGVKIVENQEANQKFFPGTTISHAVKFENTASYDQFIRAKITCNWSDIEINENQRGDTDSTGLLTLIFNKGILEEDESNEDKWIKEGEWYYYIGKIEENNSTNNLLEGIKLSTDIDSSYMKKSYNINVDVEGVQAENNGYKAWSELSSDSKILKNLDELSNNISQE